MGWDATLVSEIDNLFRKLQNNKYDILILDIVVPVPDSCSEHVIFNQTEIKEMDLGTNTGIVLAKKIWQLKRYKTIPILFLSSKSNSLILSKRRIITAAILENRN